MLLAVAVTYNLIQPSTRAWRASGRAVQIKRWSKEWRNHIQKRNDTTDVVLHRITCYSRGAATSTVSVKLRFVWQQRPATGFIIQYSSFIVHQNSIETHAILMHNLTTSLRRTLSPVCQQNAKKCNKCRKQLESKEQISFFLCLLRRRQFRPFPPKRAKCFPGCTSRSLGLSINV